MRYEVEYTNPNNITNNTYKFETRSKAELNQFLKRAHEYSGSYKIIDVKKISEAKKKVK